LLLTILLLTQAAFGRYQQVFGKSKNSKSPSPLKVKEVSIGSKRYIVCLNEDQAAKDRADREAIVGSLREALKRGDKSLIGNKGYRRFIAARGQRFVIDEQKVLQEARYDGKWVLTTNTIRSDTAGTIAKVFSACGVALPPMLSQC